MSARFCKLHRKRALALLALCGCTQQPSAPTPTTVPVQTDPPGQEDPPIDPIPEVTKPDPLPLPLPRPYSWPTLVLPVTIPEVLLFVRVMLLLA